MGATDAFACLAPEEVGVVVAPHQAARVQIERIVGLAVTQVGGGEQARHIGIVHAEGIAVAIHLEGIDASAFGMVHYAVTLNGGIHLIGQRTALLGKVPTATYGALYFGQLAKRHHGKHIGRYQEAILRGIVGGTEGREDQSYGLDGCSPTLVDL